MAIQGRGPGREPGRGSAIPEGDQDLFPPGDLVHGPYEGLLLSDLRIFFVLTIF